MKRFKFQAFVTLVPRRERATDTMAEGKSRRMVVRGQHHVTGGGKFFSALVTRSYEAQFWPEDNHVIVTVALVGDEPRQYFDVGDSFALWAGHELGSGVVTRRLFI